MLSSWQSCGAQRFEGECYADALSVFGLLLGNSKELRRGMLSFFGRRQNYLKIIEGNLRK